MTVLTQRHGDTAEWDVFITNASGPVNITGMTLVLMVKKAYADADAAAIINVNGTIVDGPAGKAHVKVPPGATSGLPNVLRRLSFDISLASGADRWTVLSGQYVIEPEVALV